MVESFLAEQDENETRNYIQFAICYPAGVEKSKTSQTFNSQ